MTDRSELLLREQRKTNELLQKLIETLNDQTRAIDELVASNDELTLRHVDQPADDAGQSDTYMDGTPI